LPLLWGCRPRTHAFAAAHLRNLSQNGGSSGQHGYQHDDGEAKRFGSFPKLHLGFLFLLLPFFSKILTKQVAMRVLSLDNAYNE
jgi:hypothetical protein